MDFDEHNLEANEDGLEPLETGSDELLADDDLRLPGEANILVRVHAVRAWLKRRREHAQLAEGEAALAFQALQLAAPETSGQNPRRRAREQFAEQQLKAQQAIAQAHRFLEAYEEASELLEEYIVHTSGQRVLVEYYLALEEMLQEALGEPSSTTEPARVQALADVQRRVEHVSTTPEDD